MTQIVDEPGPIDPRTGTRRLDLWSEDATGGAYGDDARGTAWTARYVGDDGARCAEVAVFVQAYREGERDEDDDGEPVYRYGVEMMTTVGEAVHYEPEDEHPRPSDSADVDYEPVGALDYDTLEQAQRVADYEGARDLSWALELRRPGTTTEGTTR